MSLLEKDIEDIIYNSPWLLDERYVIPRIKGIRDEYGRQINIGRNGFNRYIDLVFKDSRDDRPVIVELKKESLNRENIAQILEYKALIISMDEEIKMEWQNEFQQNYYCPKLILIGTTASEEVKISANLAGVEIRTLVGLEGLEVNFNEIKNINDKLDNWNNFLNTANRTIEDRNEWIGEIFDWTNKALKEYENKKVTTTKKLCTTSDTNSWIEDLKFPFINIPFQYEDYYLGGLYEYCNGETLFSEEYIYFDFLVLGIYFCDQENNQLIEAMENKFNEILKKKGYNVFVYGDGITTVRISREILNSYELFEEALIQLLEDAIYINNMISKVF